MDIYCMTMADVTIRLALPWPVAMKKNFIPFLTETPELPMEDFRFSCVEELPETDGPVTWQYGGAGFGTVAGCPARICRLSDSSLPFYMEVQRREGLWEVFYRRASNELPEDMMKVFGGLGLENVLLRHDRLILHSSLIRWQGRGILFSAPSGTGKSTQAELWARYQGADILNGDRAAIGKKDGLWTAYGIPVAGSSDIFRNESVPISAIVLLSQGKENVLTALSPAAALGRIYPEFTLHRWDEAFLQKGLGLILAMLSSVPVYSLSCLPDESAVTLLRNTICPEVTT